MPGFITQTANTPRESVIQTWYGGFIESIWYSQSDVQHTGRPIGINEYNLSAVKITLNISFFSRNLQLAGQIYESSSMFALFLRGVPPIDAHVLIDALINTGRLLML